MSGGSTGTPISNGFDGMFEGLISGLVEHSDAELDGLVRALELEFRRLAAERAAVLAVVEHRRVFAADGHRSLKPYLAATTNVSPSENLRRRRLARLVDVCPLVGDALLAGRIGVDHALEIDRIRANPRVAHLLSDVAPVFVERAERTPYVEFRDDVTSFLNLVDQDGAFRDLADSVAGRDASVHVIDGVLEVRAGGGDPIVSARFEAIYETFVEREFQRDVTARRVEHGDDADRFPLPRTAAQRRYDALIAMGNAAIASPDAGDVADPVVNVVIDQRTLHDAFVHAELTLPDGDIVDLTEISDDPAMLTNLVDAIADDPAGLVGRRCELSTGTPIPVAVALRAALSGHIRRVVVDSQGVVVNMGRTQRLFTGSARTAAQLLIDRCEHAGCTVPSRRCDVDHRRPWRLGGRTDQTNSSVLCAFHNRFKHRRRWRARRDDHGRLYQQRPDGTIMLPVGQRPPDLSPDELDTIMRRRLADLLTAANAA